MKPTKQQVYLPVKVEDEKIPEYTLVTVSFHRVVLNCCSG